MMKRYGGRGSQIAWIWEFASLNCFRLMLKLTPTPSYRDRYMCKCVTTKIFPVGARQLAKKIEFNDFKKALNVIRSLKLSLVI